MAEFLVNIFMGVIQYQVILASSILINRGHKGNNHWFLFSHFKTVFHLDIDHGGGNIASFESAKRLFSKIVFAELESDAHSCWSKNSKVSSLPWE